MSTWKTDAQSPAYHIQRSLRRGDPSPPRQGHLPQRVAINEGSVFRKRPLTHASPPQDTFCLEIMTFQRDTPY